MKKLLSICLSLALALSLITVPTVGVYAASTTDELIDQAVELTVGKTVGAELEEGEYYRTKFFTFTPTTTTGYQFEISDVELNEFGYTNVDMYLMENPDDEYSMDYSMLCKDGRLLLTTDVNLQAGKTYYVQVFYYGEVESYTAQVYTRKCALNTINLTAGTKSKGVTFSSAKNKVQQRYDFTAPGNYRYEFEVTNPYATKDSYAETMIEVYDADGNYMAMAWSEYGEDLICASMDKLVKGKKYYVILSCVTDTNHTMYVTARKHTHNWQFVAAEENTVYHWCKVCCMDKSGTVKVTLNDSTFTYNGKVKKPTVKVTCSNGITIPKSAYTVTNNGRKAVGKGTVTVKFKGKYSDLKKITKTYKVNPKATYIKSLTKGDNKFTVKWAKKTTQTTGYQIQYSRYSSMKNATIKTVSSNKTTSKTISGLKDKKKYYVQVRTYKTVNGVKYYSSWSKAKSVTTK